MNTQFKEAYDKIEQKMAKALEVLENEFASVRAGRANPAILDGVRVDYYGAQSPISQLASVSVPEARMLVIQPWDASVLNEIEKAIQAADLGINPNNDGKVIRLSFPPLTEERRKELVKDIHKMGENSKVAVRNVRRDALDAFKAQKKKSEITEDDLKGIEEDIQKFTDNYIKKIDAMLDNKEKELLEI